MARAIIETKLFAPRARDAHLPRPRLTDRLGAGADARLRLVSAPAGFGKTTLLADWAASAAESGAAIAWVSLDAADNDATTFWTYVATSIQRVVPASEKALAALGERPPPPMETILAALVNEFASVGGETVLILDDYHAIEAPDIHDQLGFLLDHLPDTTRIVIATRADPPLPLARLRVRGELVEIRAADLRFTGDETATYLNDIAGLGLATSDVEALEERTEGWIAALQLAGLSLQGREDAAGFIAEFAGDDRYVVDYLVEEVLQRQPEDVRRFLLHTCILDRLTGALCGAVTETPDAGAMLDRLDRENVFVIPLDARRGWYRYHHLFADVLRVRLADEEPDLVPLLHRRASEWFTRNGERDEAVRHALAGKDFERAANLIELAIPELRQRRQDALMRRWFGALPEELFAHRPVLSIGYVGALMANGEVQDIEPRLRDAERWLERQDEGSSGMIVADEAELRRLPSAIAMYRAAQAQLGGDLERTMAHAQRAYDLAGDDDPLGRGGAAGFLALAAWARGDLEAAYDFWADAADSLRAAGHAVDALAISRAMAEIRSAQGRLRDATRIYEDGLRAASIEGGALLRGAADMHVGLSELALERSDLDAAADHLQASTQLGEPGGLPQNSYRWRVAMALVREAEGNVESAIGLLDEAERVFIGEYFPVVRPIHAVRARMHAAHDRLPDAIVWIRQHAISTDDELAYLHEYEHITLARVLLARARQTRDELPARDAVTLLGRLLAAAEAGGRGRSVVEISVLLAMAHHARGELPSALASLERALAIAEPEGYSRTFLGEGAPLIALLEAAIAHGVAPAAARRLLDAADRPRRQPLAEPLSDRELEVLRLLATDLDGPDIARELVVALSTVRSHTKSIYAKLGVNSRRAAVRRADELGLIAGARR